MNGLTHRTASVTPVPVGSVMWRTYEEGGWHWIKKRNVERAKRYFDKAQIKANQFPERDVRRGRTLAGLAWVDYRIAQQSPSPEKKPVDPETLFRSARSKTTEAIDILTKAELSALERQYLAKAYHLQALISIELCDGFDAVKSLEQAHRLFGQLQMDRDYFDVLFLLAKMRQCRRQFVEAIKLFRQISEEAPEPERKFKALVDWANTLSWAGYVREAWQLRSQWQQLERELEQVKEEDRPIGEILRGRLVFARVHMLFGEFDVAEEHLQSAFCRMQPIPDEATVCCTVYWILSAQLALERGDLARVNKCLHQSQQLAHKIKLSATGYGCLEVVAIDAACQICVLETYCYEVWRRKCCCVRRCFRIRFHSKLVKETVKVTTADRKPINFAAVLAEIANGIRGGLEFQIGRLNASQFLLRNSITGIGGHVHTQSPLLISQRLLLAEVTQARKESPVKVRQEVQLASDIVSASGSSPHPVAAARDRLLANWRAQLDEYDLAKHLYGDALQHSANFRGENHPNHLILQMDLALAQGLAWLRTQEDENELQQSQEKMWPLLEKIRGVLCCHDARVGLAGLKPLWHCLLRGCVASAQRGFTRSANYWAERNLELERKLNLKVEDTRQAESLLGMLLTNVEQDVSPSEQQFADYRNLATREVSTQMVAFELNRVGMLMMRAKLLKAAKYCFDKSCELYPSQNYGDFKPTAADNLAELAELALLSVKISPPSR